MFDPITKCIFVVLDFLVMGIFFLAKSKKIGALKIQMIVKAKFLKNVCKRSNQKCNNRLYTHKVQRRFEGAPNSPIWQPLVWHASYCRCQLQITSKVWQHIVIHTRCKEGSNGHQTVQFDSPLCDMQLQMPMPTKKTRWSCEWWCDRLTERTSEGPSDDPNVKSPPKSVKSGYENREGK